MNRHYVLFIHGIGNQDTKFSKSLDENVLNACEDHIEEILGRRQNPRPTINIEKVLWANATQGVQDELWTKLYRERLGNKVYSFWSWTNPLKWKARFQDLALLREFIVSYVGDAVAYDEPDSNPTSTSQTKYTTIHDYVMKEITKCAENARQSNASKNDPALLTIVAHSLGSVIAKDLYADCIEGRYNRQWPDQLRLANFITMGSPLALYAVQFKTLEEFPSIEIQSPGRWLNVYDPQDIFGFPLKPVNSKFKKAVHADIRLNAGGIFDFLSWTPLSHAYYWNDSAVAKIIGRKLAIDYAKEGGLLSSSDIQRCYDDYDKWVADI